MFPSGSDSGNRNARRLRAALSRSNLRRSFAISTFLLLLFAALFLFVEAADAAPDGAPAEPDLSGARIVSDQGWPELQVDGKPFFVHGASFEYFGLPRDLWAHSLDRFKDLGINTIDLTIPWNWHEPAKGEFDFDGHTNPRRDLRALLHLIADRGFKLIVHAGPQMPPTWRLAGYPEWLLSAAEYGMTPEQIADGAEPPFAAEFHRDADSAAASWLAHGDFLRANHEWLSALGREIAPYSSRRKISVAPPDTWGNTGAHDASGPLLFIVVGDGSGDGDSLAGRSTTSDGIAAPNLLRYLNAFCSELAAAGVNAPCLAAPGGLPDAGLGSLAVSQETGAVHSAVAGISGQWMSSAGGDSGEADPAGETLGALDAETLTLLAETLAQQSSVPPLITGFHVGGYAAANETSPPRVEVSATLVGTRLLIGRGIAGIEYAPLQNSLTPSGYEAPGANRYLNRDAALDMEGESRTQAVAIKRNGQLVKAWGERLASAHVWADVGVVDCRGDVGGMDPSAASQKSSALEQSQRTLEQVLLVAELAGRTPEVVDPGTQSVERLLLDRVLLLVMPKPESGDVAIALSDRAQQTLLEYVRRGGILISDSSGPAVPGLADLWNTRGDALHTAEGPDAIRRSYGDGATIEWARDFYSWVEPGESASELRAHPEADWSAKILRRLIEYVGAPAIIERSGNTPSDDSLVLTELVGQEPRGSVDTLGARCTARPLCAAGFLSATNLDGARTEEADLEVLAPPETTSGAYQGTLPIHVVVPPGQSLLLPLHVPLCADAVPGEPCNDEIISAASELLAVVREQKALELTFYAPANAKVLLRLSDQPSRAELDDNNIEGTWSRPVHVFEVNVPRGAAPDFTRVLKIYLSYAPQMPKKAQPAKHPASNFDVTILNAIPLPLGQGPSLASVPPLVRAPGQEGKEEKGNRIVLRTSNLGEGTVGFEARIRGPFSGDASVHVEPGTTAYDPINILPGVGAPSASPKNGRIPEELTLEAGQQVLRFPIAFQGLGSGGLCHYTYDFERDNSLEWVLENSALRLILAPRDGGRMIALVSLSSGENFTTTVGALRDWFRVGAESELRDFTFNRSYSAEWTSDGSPAQVPASPNATENGAALLADSSVGVRMRYEASEAGASGAVVEKTVRLVAPETVEAHYRVSLTPGNGAVSGPQLQFVAVSSVPAASGEDRTTQFCWIAPASSANGGATPAPAGACDHFVPQGPPIAAPAGASHLEIRTPGHAALDLEWTAGALTVVMKSESVLLELAVPVSDDLPAETVLRYTVGSIR